jgi:putative flavoprotein involved in K+ transport
MQTIVIGAGHAGLAVSKLLTERGVEHAVLERSRVASRWRDERWDAFTIQAPNWCNWLPGWRYTGPDPEGFMNRDQTVAYIEDYARSFDAPVREGTEVSALRPAPGGGFQLTTSQGDLQARSVVVATGPFQTPRIPSWASSLPGDVTQMHSNRYRAPGLLPEGAVLIIGSGQSGQQIAEDLLEHGRTVYLSTGSHVRSPRRYRGRDFYFWRELGGWYERTAEDLGGGGAGGPTLSGVGGGHDLDLRELSARGITLFGGAAGYENGSVLFRDDLREVLAKGDAGYQGFVDWVEARLDRFHGLYDDATPRENFPEPPDAATELDIAAAGISTVIWATGFGVEFNRWIDLDIFDKAGFPVHRRGVTDVPGLLFIGLPKQHRIRSPFIRGADEDARYLMKHLV